MTVRRGPWKFVWDGGRLADVFHAESDEALDCVTVGEYSFGWDAAELQRRRANVGRAELNEAADEWMAGSAADYARELPYLIGR